MSLRVDLAHKLFGILHGKFVYSPQLFVYLIIDLPKYGLSEIYTLGYNPILFQLAPFSL